MKRKHRLSALGEKQIAKTITIPADVVQQAASWDVPAKYLEYLVHVDWFPPLTKNQHLANVMAAFSGQPAPHPDPNLVSVYLAVAPAGMLVSGEGHTGARRLLSERMSS